jgi:hypothetical protein
MTLFTAANAAALKSPDHDLLPGIYSYVTSVEFTVNKNGQFTPAIVAQLLAKLILDNPDIVFLNSACLRINADDLPTLKADFDEVSSTSTLGGRLSCQFEIQSATASFHTIKIGAWELLQKHHVWFKRAPGPARKTPLLEIGFWMNIHPGFSSTRVLRTTMVDDIAAQYAHHPAFITKFKLTKEYQPVDMYLSRN